MTNCCVGQTSGRAPDLWCQRCLCRNCGFRPPSQKPSNATSGRERKHFQGFAEAATPSRHGPPALGHDECSRVSLLAVMVDLSLWNAGRSQSGEKATTPLLKLRPRSPLQHVEQSLVFFLSKGRFQKSCRLLFLGIPTEQSFPLVLKLGGREEFI